MPTSNSRLAYEDCYEILDAATADDSGVRVKIPTHGDAVHLRTRLHTARRIDREENAKTYADPDHPMHGRSIYDRIVVRIKGLNNGVYLYLEKNHTSMGSVESLSEVTPELEAPRPMRLISPPQQEVHVQRLLRRI